MKRLKPNKKTNKVFAPSQNFIIAGSVQQKRSDFHGYKDEPHIFCRRDAFLVQERIPLDIENNSSNYIFATEFQTDNLNTEIN